jgi:hypothetical protein
MTASLDVLIEQLSTSLSIRSDLTFPTIKTRGQSGEIIETEQYLNNEQKKEKLSELLHKDVALFLGKLS